MNRVTRGLVLCGALILGAVGSSGARAQQQISGTRTSSFAYDGASGLLTQEVVEPNTSSLRLETDYVYDVFGNKISATVVGVDIASRSATTTYDARGQFRLTVANALNQSESWQNDTRFGSPTSHTGPNGLTTTWSYDSFGRKTKEVRPDGTQTVWAYLFCSGANGGTATCVAGASYLIQSTPLAADGATQIGPIGIVYFDSLDREIARDTQGFDATTIRASKQYDALGRVQKSSRPYSVASGIPQFTTFTYDVLGRAVTEQFPDGSIAQHAFHGLVTVDTNALNQSRSVTKSSQGQTLTVTDALGNSTSFAYDPFGNLLETIDAVGNTVLSTYDPRGRKVASNDPDLGAWTYAYDTVGELVSQTDAKGQTATVSYDLLGRMVQRVEPDMTCLWVYDTAANGIGKLTSASITAGPSVGYQRSYAYDSLGRPIQAATTIGGTLYAMSATYDANSHMSSVTYPSGFAVTYGYTAFGYVQQLADAGGHVLWTANARDAEQHLTQQTAGNGIVTFQNFDPQTGRLLNISAGSSNTVQSFSYTYDVLGNVQSRQDANTGLSESFTYDPLNRLTSAELSLTATLKQFAYDPIGNLLSKSDVGAYAYPEPTLPRPHAVVSIAGGTINTTFSYDANGNQTAGLGRTIAYASYNKPASITQGTSTVSFFDDPYHHRFQQVSAQGTTLYFDAFGVHVELFTASTSQWNEFLMVGGDMIGVRFNNVSAGTVATRFFHKDSLGSIAVITDENGAVLERLSFDAWGKRRFANGADDPTGSITSQTTRGFTGQEELAAVGLVHLNGRVYDPLVARMTSADPVVPDPTNGQAWNRYSYVINNPLAFTDPSGYCFLGLCHLLHDIENFLSHNLGQIFQLVATTVCVLTPGCGPFLPLVAALSSAIATGITTGSLDLALKAGLISGLTALGFADLAAVTPGASQFGSAAFFERIAGSAVVGCLSSVASGGKCGPGALSAGVSAASAPFIPTNNFVAGLLVRSVLGGLASVAGGGKFANGAFSAAFQYLATFSAEAARYSGALAALDQSDPNVLRQDEGRPLSANEIRAAEAEYNWDKLDIGLVRIKFDNPAGSGGFTPDNTIHLGSDLSDCADLTTCRESSQEPLFMHEVGHAYEFQIGVNPVKGFWDAGYSLPAPAWGEYLTKEQYLQTPSTLDARTPSTAGLNTEQFADWHMWHYLCLTRGAC
jgi:RHS repeat-associated protein